MKAGLKAHLASLGKTEEKKPITGKDLQDPKVYEAFVEDRKQNHQPIPPAQYIKEAGHHWLRFNPQSVGFSSSDIMIAQWSPTQLCWYHSNELATCAKPLFMDGLMPYWEWVAHVPVPEGI